MITAKVIQSSLHARYNKEIVTFELVYPRYIHAEVMTHRVFSRNAASSRAIPIKKVIELVEDDPVNPIWTYNQAGMQGKEVQDLHLIAEANRIWFSARDAAVAHAKQLDALGLHKQNVNRLLEPFQLIKVIITATEWNNFYALRCHEDAQPEIRQLAAAMFHAHSKAIPMELMPGEWHVPYVERKRDGNGQMVYLDVNGIHLTVEEAQKVSSSCCAQVSYRLLDESLSKAMDIYQRLVLSRPIHASPFEHQATPQADPEQDTRNFRKWVPYRTLIPMETVHG